MEGATLAMPAFVVPPPQLAIADAPAHGEGEDARQPAAEVAVPVLESAAPSAPEPAVPSAPEPAVPSAPEPALPSAPEPAVPAMLAPELVATPAAPPAEATPNTKAEQAKPAMPAQLEASLPAGPAAQPPAEQAASHVEPKESAEDPVGRTAGDHDVLRRVGFGC
eukprot:9769429-Alexandrium_andersonii.AAC.1